MEVTNEQPNYNSIDRFNLSASGRFITKGNTVKHNIKIYDSGDKHLDRYTVVLLDYPEYQPNTFTALAMSERPFDPQGFGQHTIATPGKHLGKRIKFTDLPKDCQRMVLQEFSDDNN